MQKTCTPLRRAAHKGEEQLVDVKAPGRQSRSPRVVEGAAERIGEFAPKLWGDFPPQYMVVDSETRVGDAAQHGIAHRFSIVQLLGVGGLERKSREVDHLDQAAIAGFDRGVVHVTGVGQARARRLLALLVGFERAGQQYQHAQGA